MLPACVALALGVSSAPSPTARAADDRSADKILDELKAVEIPTLDPAKRSDREAVTEYLKKRQESSTRRSALIKELYQVDPDNVRLPELMRERWMSLMNQSLGRPNPELRDEIDGVLARSKNEKLKGEAAYMDAVLAIRSRGGDPADTRKKIDEFARREPRDERGALLLYMAASQSGAAKDQAPLYRTIIESYPSSRFADMARGSLKKLEAVGKPFELEFTDAVKGTSISMKGLRGKVVVIDFWATWCGPCVAEMPKMKTLYAKYHEKGVEFIGVSLDQPEDQGGLDKLKAFVAKNEITWPQYYQGKGWDSDFSKSWGINSIPCVFIVDREGKLSSIEARGKLDTMIPELLGEDKEKADEAAGP